MRNFQCEACGRIIEIKTSVNGVMQCTNCGRINSVPRLETLPEALTALSQGNIALSACNFEEAKAAFREAIRLDDMEPSAYFKLALATFKVQYLWDEVNNRYQPICYDISERKFTDDPNYLKAIMHATSEQKELYQLRGKEIDDIHKEFFHLQNDGIDFDCFLCVKVREDDKFDYQGNRLYTQDSYRANDIYTDLKNNGYKPFYSERDIRGRTGSAYEAMILYALYKAECMLVVCSNEDHLETPWVKNEYSRFLTMLNNEEKDRDAIAFVFKGKAIQKLPTGGKKLQGIDYDWKDAYPLIRQFVENHTPLAKHQREEAKRKALQEEEARKRQLDDQNKKIEELQRKIEAMVQSTPATNVASVQIQQPTQVQQPHSEIERQVGDNPTQEQKIEQSQQKQPEITKANDYPTLENYNKEDFEIEDGVLKEYKGNDAEVCIPYGVTSIGDEAFLDCSSLTNITIPNSVISIGEYAFYGCDNLASITVENGNKNYISKNNCLVEISSKTLILGCANSIIPTDGSVTSIGNGAFNWCIGLKNITIPNSVTSIDQYAFAATKNLTSIIIPNSVTYIGAGVFPGCESLRNITVENGNKNYFSKNNCLVEISSKTLIRGCANSIIPTDGSVTSIGEYAFSECKGLTNITIPDSVTSIGEYAFSECKGLTNITIPDSVTSIGAGAFYWCKSLKRITIPNSVNSIGEYAFPYCKDLTRVTMPRRLAGSNNENLKSIFGDDYSHIQFTFTDTTGDELCIDEKREENFFASPTLENYDKTEFDIEGRILKKYKGKRAEVVIPQGVTSIGERAFFWLSSLTSVTIPNSVTSIGDGAFNSCYSLASITIPNSVTSISDSAFIHCSGLASITVENGNKNYFSKNNCLVEISGKTLVRGCANSIIPTDGSVISIGAYAFSGCKSLTNITIPNSVTSISNHAFRDCEGIIKVTIPERLAGNNNERLEEIFGRNYSKIQFTFTYDNPEFEIDGTILKKYRGYKSNVIIPQGVTAIGERAFWNGKIITSVTMPDSVTSIGVEAFGSCESLRSITIPNNVTSIGNDAFMYCKKLVNVTMPKRLAGNNNENLRRIFDNYDKIQFTFPYDEADEQRHNCEKQEYASHNYPTLENYNKEDFEIESGVLKEYKGNDAEVSIPYGVTAIGERAFWNGKIITSVTMPDSVTSIGNWAFNSCYSLASITIPNSVTSISDSAFIHCSGLTSITVENGNKNYFSKNNCLIEISGKTLICGCANSIIPTDGSVISIGAHAFSGCKSLTSITIPNSVTTIGDCAFSDCTGLTNITMPNSVTSISDSAFIFCSGLANITVENGNKNYFSKNNCLVEISSKTLVRGCANSIIPTDGSVTSIGDGAFSGCKGLTNITMPNSVTSIGKRAFFDCSSLTSITIPNSVTTIGEYAFSCCKGLTNITIPNSVTTIGDDAFYGCTGLTSVTMTKYLARRNNGKMRKIFGNDYEKIQFTFTGYSDPDSLEKIANDLANLGISMRLYKQQHIDLPENGKPKKNNRKKSKTDS